MGSARTKTWYAVAATKTGGIGSMYSSVGTGAGTGVGAPGIGNPGSGMGMFNTTQAANFPQNYNTYGSNTPS